MKVPDLNLLVYAADDRSPHHERALSWFEEVMSGTESVGFAWLVLVGFIRLATLPTAFTSPLSVDGAIDLVESWLSQPCATLIHPSERHTSILRELLGPLGSAGNITNDAHLAALAIENGAELCSADTDFARFPRLKWRDPLSG